MRIVSIASLQMIQRQRQHLHHCYYLHCHVDQLAMRQTRWHRVQEQARQQQHGPENKQWPNERLVTRSRQNKYRKGSVVDTSLLFLIFLK